MKRIGLIGGMSWHSTAMYYQQINETINLRLGNQHSADMILKSLDFATVLTPWQQEDWKKALQPIILSIREIEAAGADFFLVCSNALHKFADKFTQVANIPFLHIGETVVNKIYQTNIKTVGLLGTKITMESDFYHQYSDKKGIKVLLPSKSERSIIDDLIFTELTKGKFTDHTRARFEKIINTLHDKGAKGFILAYRITTIIFKEKT